MTNGLFTSIDDAQVLDTTLSMPYTLTTGRSAGSFLAALAEHRILGTRCTSCERVMAPPQDYCPLCATETGEFLEMPQTGSLTAITRTDQGLFGFIQIDGANTSMVHRLIDDTKQMRVGDRVTAVWAESPTSSILDLAGFTSSDAPADGTTPPTLPIARTLPEPVVELPYRLNLNYHHSYGPHYGRLFDEIASRRRIIGSFCPRCRNVLVPPREFCDACFTRTESHVDVADTGTLQAFSVIYMEFMGQTRKPPYIYAEVVLDGSATRLIHTVGGIDVDEAKERLHVGMSVRAVWKNPEECVGTLNDIDYFEPIFPES